MIGITGSDWPGEWLAETLRREGLDVSRFRRVDGHTAVSTLHLEGPEAVYDGYDEGVLATAEYDLDQIAFAAAHDLVHSTPWSHVDDYLPALASGGARISFDYSGDVESPRTEQTLGRVDFAFFSLGADRPDAAAAVRSLGGRCPGVVVGTLGSRGSIAWDGRQLHVDPGMSATPVNAVGAGDAFIAGFLASVLRGRSVPECLAAGARTAADVVQVFGPWVGAEVRPIGHPG